MSIRISYSWTAEWRNKCRADPRTLSSNLCSGDFCRNLRQLLVQGPISTYKFSRLNSIHLSKNSLREFDKRSKPFCCGDHFIDSRNREAGSWFSSYKAVWEMGRSLWNPFDARFSQESFSYVQNQFHQLCRLVVLWSACTDLYCYWSIHNQHSWNNSPRWSQFSMFDSDIWFTLFLLWLWLLLYLNLSGMVCSLWLCCMSLYQLDLYHDHWQTPDTNVNQISKY